MDVKKEGILYREQVYVNSIYMRFHCIAIWESKVKDL